MGKSTFRGQAHKALAVILFGLLGLGPFAVALGAPVPALVVNGPGSVLMVDGTDSNVTVTVAVADATFPIGRYDFGFMGGTGYTRITSIAGSRTFLGGSIVDFALRDRGGDGIFGTGDDTVYAMSDPADYADQWYFGPVAASYSRNPVVSSEYYRTLTLFWDLNADGVQDAGFSIAAAQNLRDGMAPVPLPAAVWLLGSGLLSFGAFVRGRQARKLG